MPTAPKLACPKCPNRQPCPTHARKPYATAKTRQYGGSGWRWQRIRRLVILRDDGVCQLRLPPCTSRATTADHVVGVALGGSDDPSNLVAACAPCNEYKRRQQARAGRAAYA